VSLSFRSARIELRVAKVALDVAQHLPGLPAIDNLLVWPSSI
jgi:hypothetical protein